MTTVERDFDKLKLNDPSPKGKQEMLPPKSIKNQTDLEKAESEDNTDAVPANKPTATAAVPHSNFPLQQQPDNEEVSTRTRPSSEGGESSPIQDVIPQVETTGGNSNDKFYDIFLMHSGKRSVNTRKFQEICERREWTVKSFDTIPATTPVHEAIGRMLSTATHLALIITEDDCIKYKKREMCLTVEMALQLAYSKGTLDGKVLPIRCCMKSSLPLVLQALTGAHIDEESFEERLVETIDTKTRVSRENKN